MKLQETYRAMQMHQVHFRARDPFCFSFGSKEYCKQILIEALEMVDKTTSIKWLPEYDEVVEWMHDNKGKGLLLQGDCGRGKTNIVMFALPILFLHKFQKIVKPVHIDKLGDKLQERDFLKKWGYAVDEIGAEPETSDYGVKYFPFMRLVSDAEINVKTCLFSTNLTSAQLKSKYDERTLDRIVRLCKVIKFKGPSLRK